jgi:hypothetical protein
MVGEWSVSIGPANRCNPGGKPVASQVAKMWIAQKWGYLSNYKAYRGKALNGSASSFVGDFFWNVRMGYNWNPDPSVCAGNTSTTDYDQYGAWDWSMIRLIKLGLVKPISQQPVSGGGGLTMDKLDSFHGVACSGSWKTC